MFFKIKYVVLETGKFGGEKKVEIQHCSCGLTAVRMPGVRHLIKIKIFGLIFDYTAKKRHVLSK